MGASAFNAGAGAITLNNAGNNFVGAVNLTNTGANDIAINDVNALTLGNVSMTAAAAGRLTVNANGAITQVAGTAINTGTGLIRVYAEAGAITLVNAGNNFRGITDLYNTGDNNIALQTAGALALNGLFMTPTGLGGLSLTTNGAITQIGSIFTGRGAVTINSGAGAITLRDGGNDFRGAVSLANTGANNITITDINALELGGVSMQLAAGTLLIRSNGNITQASGTRISTGTGAVTIDSGATPATISAAR
ncbi:MAG: hypothetical protein EBR07_04280 [Planctomycetes bacterium]|nr:hypothetical protein [Planctomycetota bacterium]